MWAGSLRIATAESNPVAVLAALCSIDSETFETAAKNTPTSAALITTEPMKKIISEAAWAAMSAHLHEKLKAGVGHDLYVRWNPDGRRDDEVEGLPRRPEVRGVLAVDLAQRDV